MATVHWKGSPAGAAPKPQNYAQIGDQGRIPYGKLVNEKTPNTAKAKITTGESRGMGAALRGGKFTIA